MHEYPDLLVARTREAKVLRECPCSPARLGDRLRLVVEFSQGGDESTVEARRLNRHTDRIARTSSQHTHRTAPELKHRVRVKPSNSLLLGVDAAQY